MTDQPELSKRSMAHGQRPAHWPAPPSGVSLKSSSLHLWSVDLDAETEADFRPLLNAQEQDRAARFHFPRDRRRFVVCRGLLRKLLAFYTGTSAEQIEFACNPFGKPALQFARSALHFNLSHSGPLALLAFSRAQEVGVDLEQIRPIPEEAEIASRFFSSQEAESLNELPPEEKMAAFFRCWTRKEAYLKASGHGLATPLDSFSVSLKPGEPAALLSIQIGEASSWSIIHLEPAPGFLGAAAFQGTLEIQKWRLSSSILLEIDHLRQLADGH
jgi:4'-phosphopantetheinyl transferase